MEYQKNKTRPKFKKTEKPFGFHGYYVEVREGEDAVRAYRKIKRWIKEDKFIEQIRERAHFIKPSETKREKAKEKKKILRKLQRERDDTVYMGRRNHTPF